MSLIINKSYLLNTKGGSVTNKKVRITGILGYDQAKKMSYDLQVAAIHETVLTESDDPADYFKDKQFYLGEELDSTNIYLVWEEIIDYSKTTLLEYEYEGTIKLKTSQDLDVPISTVVSNIETYLNTTYGTKVIPNISIYGSSDAKSDEQIFEERIAKYESILTEFEKLSAVLPAIAQIEELDLMGTIASINKEMNDIKSSIGVISANLS